MRWHQSGLVLSGSRRSKALRDHRVARRKCPCSERVEHQRGLMVKFECKCVPIEQDEPFDKQASSGKMKHNLLVFETSVLGRRRVLVSTGF